MLKPLIAIFNLIGLFFVGAFVAADIRISQDAPAMLPAGTEVKVTVTVEKADLGGFAKLQIDLPAGLSATAIETKGASFTFADGKAKFIWMALPASPKFAVTYTLKADAMANGTMNINGKFSYIEDNERKTYDIATSTVQVTAAPVAEQTAAPVEETIQELVTTQPAPTDPVVTNEPPADNANDIVTAAGAAPVMTAEELPLPAPGPLKMVAPQQGAGSVSATRTITAVTETEMLVEVVVNKGAIRGFGKLQEMIPAGFTALEKTSDEAIFTAQGTIVKFVWLNLPAKNELKVVYKLRGTGQPEGDYVVNGEFGYLLNDETQKATVGSTAFKLGPQALAQQQPQQEPQKTQEGTIGQQEQATQEQTAQQTKPPTTNGRIPGPETGVTYKVQITAAHREVGPEYFAERHHYMGEFGIERHEGWIKYVTGRFTEYRAARDQRQSYVAAGHNFPGPFVTAYNNGDRITVQEALMISQQRWVQ